MKNNKFKVITFELKIHSHIRKLRESKGLSQVDTAKLLGCFPLTYSRYGSNTSEMPITFSQLYNTSSYCLIGLTEIKKPYLTITN